VKLSKSYRLCLFISLLALSCGKAQNSNDEPDRAQTGLRTVTLRVAGHSIVAEIASSEKERSIGLMFRESIQDGFGMLFVYDRDRRMSFWMKNTKVPLSIAFIASDGTIREIRDMEPGSLDEIDSETSVRYALEVPKGWFGRNGIDIGRRIEIPQSVLSPNP
jgi:hypothetical protein